MSDQSDSRPDQRGPEPDPRSGADSDAPSGAGMPEPAPMPQPPPMSYRSSPEPAANPPPAAQPQPAAPQAFPAPPAGYGAPPQPSGHGAPPQPSLPPGYVLANPYLQPTTTGLGSGGLVSGVLSCLLGLLSCCWWPMFALPALMGAGAVLLGYLGMRQVNASSGEVTGRGISIAAMATGGAGLFLTVVAVVLGLILQARDGVFGG